MAEITAAAVKALREMTDLPMMACKKALREAGGDQDKAIEILREEAGKIQLKRSDNATSEGRSKNRRVEMAVSANEQMIQDAQAKTR